MVRIDRVPVNSSLAMSYLRLLSLIEISGKNEVSLEQQDCEGER